MSMNIGGQADHVLFLCYLYGYVVSIQGLRIGRRVSVTPLENGSEGPLELRQNRGRTNREQLGDSGVSGEGTEKVNVSVGGLSDALTRIERLARLGRLNPSNFRDIANEVIVAAGQEPLNTVSSRAWCDGWKAAKRVRLSSGRSGNTIRYAGLDRFFSSQRRALPSEGLSRKSRYGCRPPTGLQWLRTESNRSNPGIPDRISTATAA